MRKNAGFSTVELALVLLAFGILMTILVGGYRLYSMQGSHEKTKEDMKRVEAALFDFKNTYGFYPCPANPQVGRGNSNYGRSDCSLTAVAGARDARPNASDNVLIGAVPFATLSDPDNNPATNDSSININENVTLDGWGRKMTYAISQNLTSLSTYNNDYGTINVVDENNNSTLAQPNSAHFIVVSHGENGRGAYMPDGTLVEACPGTLVAPIPGQPATVVNETENCDNDAKFISGLINENDHSYQDDLTIAGIDQGAKLWERVKGSNDIYNANAGNVGIGILDPKERLDIDGDLTATRVDASLYCDSQGQNCMPADFLGGPATKQGQFANRQPFRNSCNAGEVVVGIENNQVICEPAFTTAGNCPSGQVMIGMTKSGIICCPSNYPVAGHPNPHCRSDVCVPQAETRSSACPVGQTGNIIEERRLTCPANTWTAWTVTSNSCTSTCAPATETRTQACPAGQEGEITQSRNFTCPSGTWSEWAQTSSTCQTAAVCYWELGDWFYSASSRPITADAPGDICRRNSRPNGWVRGTGNQYALLICVCD